MKHGDKAKSKAASKASGKKASSKAGAASKSSAKSSKTVQSVKSPRKAEKPAESSKSQAGGNGKPRPRGTSDTPGFSNPVVANAFKRAIKKYPNAFRRLTD